VKKDPQIQESNQDDFVLLGSFDARYTFYHLENRFLILDISLFDQRLTFVSLYGYNSDEPEMFNEIMKNIASYSNTSYLLCGTFYHLNY
jgi:hypothetical protein